MAKHTPPRVEAVPKRTLRPAGVSLNGPKSHRDGSITGIVVGATPVVAPTPNEWADEASGEKDATDDDIDAAFMAFLRL